MKKNWKQRMLIAWMLVAWIPWIVGGAVLGLASVKIGEALLAEKEEQTVYTYEVPELYIVPELHIVEPENPDVYEVTP